MLCSSYDSPSHADEDAWPTEARFVVAAHRGNVGRLKGNNQPIHLFSPTPFSKVAPFCPSSARARRSIS
jgi:hypothetical protein